MIIRKISLSIIGLITLLGFAHCDQPAAKVQKSGKIKELALAFYNVENLFDTIDDPFTADDEFTPGTEKDWNALRYNDKLSKLGNALSQGQSIQPALIGLCEIENRTVLEDLANTTGLNRGKYEIVHFDSPDQRGIDVGLLYAKGKIKVLNREALKVTLEETDRPTRDILYVKCNIIKGPVLHVFVNHWPSRGGGEDETRPKRIAAATVLRKKIDSILKEDQEASILCMGDFNDYPVDQSIFEILGAEAMGAGTALVNMMNGLKENERGSYNYRGDWGFLDQIIVSRNLIDGSLPDLKANTTKPYFSEDMLYIDQKYGDEKPNKTYGGSKYYGGFSDHLPVFTVLQY